ncbi:MAG: hypothetical protein IPJ77_17750 [Planctomycetes bacterium]|nr:hypothetical protein [Planctomycetota bacterium]
MMPPFFSAFAFLSKSNEVQSERPRSPGSESGLLPRRFSIFFSSSLTFSSALSVPLFLA